MAGAHRGLAQLKKTYHSRQEALDAGAPRFLSTKPCVHGHVGWRHTANWVCVECNTLRQRALKRRQAVAKAGREQPAACEACGEAARLVFDHEHESGKFRGWICQACNLALGHANDSPKRLRALAEYLEKYNGKADDRTAQLRTLLGLRTPRP